MILLSEKYIHSKIVDNYWKQSILPDHITLWSRCDTCTRLLSDYNNIGKSLPCTTQELTNLLWHLHHIVRKASRLKIGSVERAILVSKFAYFAILLAPRFLNKSVRGELPAIILLRRQVPDILKAIEKIIVCIPSLVPNKDLIEVIKKFEKLSNLLKSNIWIEGNEIIRPYNPPSQECIENMISIKKIISHWDFTQIG